MQLRILMRPPATARNTYLIPCYQITSNKNQISKLQALYRSPKFPIMFTKKYVTLPFLSLHLPYLLRKKPLLHSPAVQRVFAAPVWRYFVARPKHSQLQGLRAGRRRSVEKPENGRWENPMGFMGFIFPLPPPQFLFGVDIVQFWGGNFLENGNHHLAKQHHTLLGIKILVYDLVYASLVLSVWMFLLSLCPPRDIVAYDVCFDMIREES